jgi:hypothetical protein
MAVAVCTVSGLGNYIVQSRKGSPIFCEDLFVSWCFTVALQFSRLPQNFSVGEERQQWNGCDAVEDERDVDDESSYRIVEGMLPYYLPDF